MVSIGSKIGSLVGRLLKWLMVALMLPAGVGLLVGIMQELDASPTVRGTVGTWARYGFFSYIGVHLLLYRPVTLFRIGQRLFAVLAVWLFGGQVASTEGGSRTPDKEKSAKPAKGEKGKGTSPAQGSTLVAFSPYVVPLYVVLACAAGWALQHWWSALWVNAAIGYVIGAAMALHWLMTADELQQQRERWHLETYVLAIGLVFVITLLIGSACLSWTIPEYAFFSSLADGWARAQELFLRFWQALFGV